MRRWETRGKWQCLDTHRFIEKHSARNHEMVRDSVEIYEKVNEWRTPK